MVTGRAWSGGPSYLTHCSPGSALPSPSSSCLLMVMVKVKRMMVSPFSLLIWCPNMTFLSIMGEVTIQRTDIATVALTLWKMMRKGGFQES